MPWSPPRYCTKTGHAAFTGRRCPECQRAWDRAAGSSAARGYGQDWRDVRAAVLDEEPLCRFCAEKGLVVAATDVDHIQPLLLRPDLRLVRSNLRPLCKSCHQGITRAFNMSRAKAGGSSTQGIGGARSRPIAAETEPQVTRAISPGMGFARKGGFR